MNWRVLKHVVSERWSYLTHTDSACTGSLQRIVRLGGPVDDDMANLIVAQLLYLDSTGKGDITMYVNSPGGSVTAGKTSGGHSAVGVTPSPWTETVQ
jgi:ATP-dependent protease ClpP protease subunit